MSHHRTRLLIQRQGHKVQDILEVGPNSPKATTKVWLSSLHLETQTSNLHERWFPRTIKSFLTPTINILAELLDGHELHYLGITI